MTFLRYYIYYLLLHLTLVGSSLVQIGDAVSVNLDSSITYKHSSNILRSVDSNELSDYFTNFSPGALVNFGKPGSALDIDLKTNYDIIKYSEYSDLDINLSKIYLNGSFNSGDKLLLTFNYSDLEGQSARSETNTLGSPALVETSKELASLLARYRLSTKLLFSLGFNTSDLEYNTFARELASSKSRTIPLNLTYQYSDKLGIVYGVALTNTEIGGRISSSNVFPSYETDSIYYNIGLTGVILPKLKGNFNVGYRELEFSFSDDDLNSIGASSALTWELTPKVRTTINFHRNFDVSGSGGTYQYTTASLLTVYNINSEFKCSIDLGDTVKTFKTSFRPGETPDREDNLRSIGLNLHYFPTRNCSFVAGYRSISSESAIDYDLKEFRFTANFLY